MTLGHALRNGEATSLRESADADAALDAAPSDKVIEAEYSVPFLAHATMEPMNATARMKDGRLGLWASNQAPTILRTVCSGVAGIDAENVDVHTTFLSGGFGRRGEVDFAIYATELAKHTEGRAREGDLDSRGRHGPRTPTGRPPAPATARYSTATECRRPCTGSSPPRRSSRASWPAPSPACRRGGPDKTLIEGAYDQPYEIPDYRVDAVPADLAIPVGFWRSVGNSFNPFMHGSFLDEIAAAGGKDPLALRLELVKPWPTATAVLQRVDEMTH